MIEITVNGKVCRQYLKPGDAPEATFCAAAGDAAPRSYCNKHGLWKG